MPFAPASGTLRGLKVFKSGLGALLTLFSRQCPDSACKQDLLAYLQRIALYCHQLNICSKVKAEVQNLGGELVVSGVSVICEKKWVVGLVSPCPHILLTCPELRS